MDDGVGRRNPKQQRRRAAQSASPGLHLPCLPPLLPLQATPQKQPPHFARFFYRARLCCPHLSFLPHPCPTTPPACLRACLPACLSSFLHLPRVRATSFRAHPPPSISFFRFPCLHRPSSPPRAKAHRVTLRPPVSALLSLPCLAPDTRTGSRLLLLGFYAHRPSLRISPDGAVNVLGIFEVRYSATNEEKAFSAALGCSHSFLVKTLDGLHCEPASNRTLSLSGRFNVLGYRAHCVLHTCGRS